MLLFPTCSSLAFPVLLGYAAGMETIVSKHIKDWCNQGQVMALAGSRRLAFETTAQMLLGCDFSQSQMDSMMVNMEVMADNFFTLAIDLPGFGFHKVSSLSYIDLICLKHIRFSVDLSVK